MTNDKSTIGLYIRRENSYGMQRVVVTVMLREDGANHPRNLSYSSYCDNVDASLADLTLDGFVSDYGDDFRFLCSDVEYKNVYSVDARRAEIMLKTLRRIKQAMVKAEASEPGDMLMTLAQTIKAQWCMVETEHRGHMLADSKWRFMTLGEGRNELRRMIETARQDTAESKGKTLRAA